MTRLGDAPNVLVVAPHFGGHDVHADLLPRDLETLVGVAVSRSADRWLDAMAPHLPGRVHVVDVGGRTRSAAGTGPVAAGRDVTITPVPEQGNLTRLGVVLTTCFASIEDRPGPAGLCFDAVAPLYQFADERTVFRFLQVLAGHVAADGLVGHYHLDPAAIGERADAQLRLLFDAVVTVAEDGGLTVERGPGDRPEQND